MNVGDKIYNLLKNLDNCKITNYEIESLNAAFKFGYEQIERLSECGNGEYYFIFEKKSNYFGIPIDYVKEVSTKPCVICNLKYFDMDDSESPYYVVCTFEGEEIGIYLGTLHNPVDVFFKRLCEEDMDKNINKEILEIPKQYIKRIVKAEDTDIIILDIASIMTAFRV